VEKFEKILYISPRIQSQLAQFFFAKKMFCEKTAPVPDVVMMEGF
jgi:hypothetical protein